MYNSKRQKNIIIGSLLAIVCIMAIGYAAFATKLNISGSGAISSNWNVLITNVTSKDIVGNAGNKSEPTYEALTATFNASLENPGDSITYDITVSNQGTLDAVLNKITLSDSSNSAIIFETSGLTEGDDLLKSTSKVLTVKVTYNNSVTSQPENVTANLTVTLEFGQKGLDENGIAVPGITTNELKALAVTTGDGLYADSVESGRYIFRGSSPDNYITFNGESAGWRIISVESDETIKIIKDSNIGYMAWDDSGNRSQTNYCNKSTDYGCNSWGSSSTMTPSTMATTVGGTAYTLPSNESSLNTYLNGEYYNSLNSTEQSKIVSYTFNVGVLGAYDDTSAISTLVTREKANKWTGKIALMNITDFMRTTTSTSCTSLSAGYGSSNAGNCTNNNWMFKSTSEWTLSPYSNSNSYLVWAVYSDGYIGDNFARTRYGVRPALYLRSDITLSGSGTSSDPYTISG